MADEFTAADFAPAETEEFTAADFAPRAALKVAGPPKIALSPYEQADIASMEAGRGKALTGMEPTTEFTTALGEAPEKALRIAIFPGRFAYASAADLLASGLDQPQYGGEGANVKALLRGEQLPAERYIAETAPLAPNLAVAANIGESLAEMAPLAGMGALPAWANRLIAAGFSIDMIRNAGPQARELGEEMGKPEDQQDKGKIARLQSGLILAGVFAPLAGAGAASGLLRGRPETITRSAVIDPKTGLPEYGANHPEILERLGETVPPREERNTPQFGFETTEKPFVTRPEAAPIAKAADQQLETFDEGDTQPHSDQISAKPGSETPLAEAKPEPPPAAPAEPAPPVSLRPEIDYGDSPFSKWAEVRHAESMAEQEYGAARRDKLPKEKIEAAKKKWADAALATREAGERLQKEYGGDLDRAKDDLDKLFSQSAKSTEALFKKYKSEGREPEFKKLRKASEAVDTYAAFELEGIKETASKKVGPEVIPTRTEAPAPKAPEPAAIVPQEVVDASKALYKAEKRYRRAKRQEPGDIADADEARIEAEGIFRDLAAKNKISQEDFDRLLAEAKATETDVMAEAEPAAPEPAAPAAEAPKAPAAGGNFVERMKAATTADEGRTVIHEHEAAINALERSAGLVPTVGQVEPKYYRGFSTVKPAQWKKRIAELRKVDAAKAQQLADLVKQGKNMEPAWVVLRDKNIASLRAELTKKPPAPAAPQTAAAKVETGKPTYEVSFESPSGGRATVSVRRVKFDELPDSMKKLIEEQLKVYHTLQDWKEIDRWEKVKNGKTPVTLWEKREGEEVTHNISLESPETEFKNWAMREDLYDKKYNAAGQGLRDKLLAEREATEKAAEDKRKAEEVETTKKLEDFAKYRAVIEKVQLPKGETQMMRVVSQKGDESFIRGVKYGDWFIHKVEGGKGRYAQPTVYKVSHFASGLGISGDGLPSLQAAKNYVRALIHGKARGNWIRADQLTKAEKAHLMEIGRAWAAGGDVPSYFKAEATPPPPPSMAGPKESAKAEAQKVQTYAAGMVQSAGNYIRRSIDSGKTAKEAALEWAREIGMGLMDTPEEVYRKERGGLYTSSYVKGVFGSKEGVAVNAKEYLAAVDAGRREGLEWKRRGTAGPGTPSATQPSDVSGSQLAQLTQAIRQQSISPKEPLRDRIAKAINIADRWAAGKDAVTRGIGHVRAASSALLDFYLHLPEWRDYDTAVGRWTGADQATAFEVRNFRKIINSTVPNKLRQEAITNWIQADGNETLLRERAAASKGRFKRGYEVALELNDAEKTLARNVSSYLDAKLQEGIDAGLLKQGVDNYVTQIWRKPNTETNRMWADLFGLGKLNPNFRFARKRIFDSYFEGEQAGFVPRTKNIGDLISAYDLAFNRALSARGLIKELHEGVAKDGNPIVMISGSGVPVPKDEPVAEAFLIKPKTRPQGAIAEDGRPYRKVDHWALEDWKWVAKSETGQNIFVKGDMLVHPDYLSNMPGKPNLANALKGSVLRQNPVTRFLLQTGSLAKQTKLSLSPFHTVQEGLHSMAHRVDPTGVVKSLATLDLNHPQQRALVDHGLMIADPNAQELFSEGLSGGGLVGKIPGLGRLQQWYTEKTFQDFIPRLKMTMALDALERNRKTYAKELASGKVTDDQIVAMTARQSNAAFGEQNYRMMGRSPTLQDFLRLSLLAPDFLEARFRFVGQALKPYGREQQVALGLMAATLYTTSRLMNKALDDDYHWDKPFSVFYKGREYHLRTLLGDVQHLLTDPRSFWYNRLAPITRTMSEYITGRDDRGIKRSSVEQFADFLKWFQPIPLQRRPGETPVQQVLQASGVPSRLGTKQQEIYQLADSWLAKQTDPKIKAAYDRRRQETRAPSPYTELRQALRMNELGTASRLYTELLKTHKPDSIAQAMNWRRPVTGSTATEQAFRNSLSASERKIYDEAVAERKLVADRFMQVVRGLPRKQVSPRVLDAVTIRP